MSEAALCYVIPDVRGDYGLLLNLFVNVAKIVRNWDAERHWEWLAPPETCVILLGNYIHCYEDSKRDLTVHDAVEREKSILEFILRMQQLAERNKCKVVALIGHEEMGAIVDDVDCLLRGLRDPKDPNQRRMRQNFVNDVLIPFAASQQVMVQWGDYLFSPMGLELKWVRDVEFTTVTELNSRFRLWIQSGQVSELKKWFWREDSVLCSTAMAFHPMRWRNEDQPLLDQRMASFTPKYVISGPLLADVRRKAVVGAWEEPACKDATPRHLLTFGQGSVMLLNSGLSDVWGKGRSPPAVLQIKAHFSQKGRVLTYDECMLLSSTP